MAVMLLSGHASQIIQIMGAGKGWTRKWGV